MLSAVDLEDWLAQDVGAPCPAALQAGAVPHIADELVDIVTRMNLRALNAVIDAAQEAEAGRGFGGAAAETGYLVGYTTTAAAEMAAQIARLEALADALTAPAPNVA